MLNRFKRWVDEVASPVLNPGRKKELIKLGITLAQSSRLENGPLEFAKRTATTEGVEATFMLEILDRMTTVTREGAAHAVGLGDINTATLLNNVGTKAAAVQTMLREAGTQGQSVDVQRVESSVEELRLAMHQAADACMIQ